MDSYYVGTDLKFLTEITAEGFDMALDEFDITLRCGSKKVEVTEENFVKDSEDNWYLLVDTKQLGSGTLQMIVTAHVPDSDFPAGTRTEVMVKDLAKLQKP